ncbi:ABC transporter permease [Microbacterium album]|uniref:ABC transporter permease n=1 Tax=Microbacterium album TaxID=2053191 RepID=A0A917MM96_9MICO|nr:ABC transporter permease [Microbacterium album]GGH47130.1 ABC transporter permease [Microbacterium album]
MNTYLTGLGTIVALELRQRVRSVAWYVLLGVFALLLLIVTVLAFLVSGTWEAVGGFVYSIVIFFVLLLATLVSPALSGNAINGDRDAATLAPVQVTLATTGQIVLGKFLAAWVTGLAFLAAAVPFILIATVAGNSDPGVVAVSLLVLMAEVGVVAAIGVGLSGVLARPLFSVAVTYLTVAALSIGTLIAFGLGGAAVRSEVVSTSRYIEYGVAGQEYECSEWQTYTYETPRFDLVWGFLAANPYVILADATPTTFDRHGNPVDLFGQIKLGARHAQRTPDLNPVDDGCVPTPQGFVPSSGPSWATGEEVIASTTPSWFVGLGSHVLLAAGALAWAWSRNRTPAGRLPQGTRVA